MESGRWGRKGAVENIRQLRVDELMMGAFEDTNRGF
jgi:hypothetical protein